MPDKILFVDDDPNLLTACARMFRKDFTLVTALGGEAALAVLAADGPFAVAVSDMHMPGMDGIQFLSAVKERAPDTVRIMLTGNADLAVAIRVVNEGNIFRFLTKPCPPETLAKALHDAQRQYRLVTAEKELLNKTLSGSITLLTDILATVDAHSFGRAEKMRALVDEVGRRAAVTELWEVHLAVMLARIGYVTLPPETLVKTRIGEALNRKESQLVATLPDIAARLLANIPRLEGVARIVRYQHKHFNGGGFPDDNVSIDDIPWGARLLKILNDLQQLQTGGTPIDDAWIELRRREGLYDLKLLDVVRSAYGVLAGQTEFGSQAVAATLKELKVGMHLAADVCATDGTLILAAGHHISEMILEKLQNFEHVVGIKEPIFVQSRPHLRAAAAGLATPGWATDPEARRTGLMERMG